MPALVPRKKKRSSPLCLKLRINVKRNLIRYRYQPERFPDFGIVGEKFQSSNPYTIGRFSQDHRLRYVQEGAIPNN
jgi:hypothetical protein